MADPTNELIHDPFQYGEVTITRRKSSVIETFDKVKETPLFPLNWREIWMIVKTLFAEPGESVSDENATNLSDV